MMEDKWKDFFEKSKPEFQDEFELPLGHEERFLRKLNKNKERIKFRLDLWKVAAVLVPALMLAVYFALEFQSEPTGEKLDLAEYSPELGEAENYFAFVVSEKVKEVKSLKNPENKVLIEDSLHELDLLQKSYIQLLADLKQSGGNPQVIKSVMMNLQLQIEVLESVLNQIEFKQEIKNTTDENLF